MYLEKMSCLRPEHGPHFWACGKCCNMRDKLDFLTRYKLKTKGVFDKGLRPGIEKNFKMIIKSGNIQEIKTGDLLNAS
jgi:hypothetical protein